MGDLTVAEVLAKAADLIEPEGAWTKGVLARTATGRVTFDEDGACQFCMDGAIRMVGHRDLTMPYEPALRVVRGLIKREVGTWNDAPMRQQYQVVAKLREAAALAAATPSQNTETGR